MNIASSSIKNRSFTLFTVAVFTIAGIASFFALGKLEDPEFTVKTAVVVTQYPGASPEEVELEVTNRIELVIQEMPELKRVRSISRAGLSMIYVDLFEKYSATELPQIWDVLRKKIRDKISSLPPGTSTPKVVDEFGDVYGSFIALTSDGFSYSEMEEYLKNLKKELSLVAGVKKIDFWGVQSQAIYIDISQSQISQLGIPFEVILGTLASQNMVVDSGSVDVQTERLRIDPTGEFTNAEDIENLTFRWGGDQLIRLGDIGTVRRDYVEPTQALMRFNGQPAYGMAISNLPGENIINLGKRLDKRLDELIKDLPIGIEVNRIAWQGDIVDNSIKAFVINLIEAVLIVVAVLWVSMGFRMAIIVGVGGLLITIIGTLVVMKIGAVDLHRMSLGALVIAMGMMVDNAIVVADGIAVRMKQGMSRSKAAIEAATQPSIPLLGATAIAVMAFYPIFAAPSNVGEYCGSLFSVIGASLMLSWLLAVTLVPIMCMKFIPEADEKNTESEGGDYNSTFYNLYKKFLSAAIKGRYLFVGVMIVLLVLSVFGFQFVDKAFFPSSSRPQVMLDYWAPAGTKVEYTAKRAKFIEQKVLSHPATESISTFVGKGPPRFYLPVEPEKPYSSYAHFVVNVKDSKGVDQIIEDIEPWMKKNLPEAQAYARRFGLGPSNTWKIEARFSGPANADPEILRNLASKATDILEKHKSLLNVYRLDWRERIKKVVPEYDQKRGRWTGVSRRDLSHATKRFYDGIEVGQYREKDLLLPIVLRQEDDDRKRFEQLGAAPVRPSGSGETVPVEQVVKDIEVKWEDPFIWRWNRRRAVTVQANAADGIQPDTLRNAILHEFEQIELPHGYTLEWKGDFDSTTTAQASLIPGLIPSVIIMALTVVALFNAFRPPLIIVSTIPFVLIGISSGLLITGQSFGFMALLGAMSLAGMMIKNAIVLLDQINIELAGGKDPYNAVMDSAVSRLGPVLNAAGTTVLGVMPLLQDVFWVAMSVTIMFGLTVGTVLTMVLIPVLYSIFYKVKLPPK